MRLLLLVAFLSAPLFAEEILKGQCQGQGCGCVDENASRTKTAATLYEKMDKASKVVGKVKAGTAAKLSQVYVRVVNPGVLKIAKIDEEMGPEDIPVKVGDTITTPFYLGEGEMKLKFKDKWFEFPEKKLFFEEIEKPVMENWFEITAGKLHGFSMDFPFAGCVE
jgi:hypothetical protein